MNTKTTTVTISVFLFAAGAALAYDNADKIMLIEPGMRKEEVLQIIGQPDAIEGKSVNEKGQPVEVYRYIFSTQVLDEPPAKESFMKPEYGRDAKSDLERETEADQEMTSPPPYLIRFVDDVVQSVKKS